MDRDDSRKPWTTPELRQSGAETTEFSVPAQASDGSPGYATVFTISRF